jgi:glutaredoxin
MEIIKPLPTGFTIYSKSGCPNCNKVKLLLKEKYFLFSIIDCDEYILENKDFFLLFIKEQINKDWKTFPIVFDNGKFIGGYQETQKYIDKLFLSFEENNTF